MKINPKEIWNFIKQVFEQFIDDRCPKLGAALSFYTIFSLAPLLIIAISVAGFIFGETAAQGGIVNQIKDLVGREGAEVIQTALKNARYEDDGLLAISISFITMLIGSTVVFIELQDSLNMIWKVKPKPGRNMIRGLIVDRLQSFAIVVGTGFLLLVSLLVSAIISAINNFLKESFYAMPVLMLDIINIVISFGVIFLLFMAIFKVLPDVHLEWRYVWVGAIVTAGLFVLGKFLIGLYLGSSTLGSTYGAAGSLVVLLLWIYYSSQILFLGAEFTQVYANKYGKGIRPTSKFMKYENVKAAAETAEKVDEKKKDNAERK
jgi:membrane protein